MLGRGESENRIGRVVKMKKTETTWKLRNDAGLRFFLKKRKTHRDGLCERAAHAVRFDS